MTVMAREAGAGGLNWGSIADQLHRRGFAVVPSLIDPGRCAALASLYDRDAGFRSRVVMARHGFGQGEYKYFDNPLPEPVGRLRERLYAGLAGVANRWAELLKTGQRFPPTLDRFLDDCHAAGQAKPTPLLLQYGPGDYNCLHQDLYGALAFPIQATVLLSRPATDFAGGEFVLTEQRPRRQSRAQVVSLGQGDCVVFAVNQRPEMGSRGAYRVTHRHGVSEVTRGLRRTLGIIFHDAA